ncbi:hypothetical protein QQX98_001756 [Neonectria punicea]|uniref:CCHC-type domain-containing protein n=1 Tax=Neonectria punicea TaxID=979145 RepID=A0ABR1HLZ6_9HYPO
MACGEVGHMAKDCHAPLVVHRRSVSPTRATPIKKENEEKTMVKKEPVTVAAEADTQTETEVTNAIK